MKTVVDIDILLAEDELEITLKGVKYTLVDVELASFMKAIKADSDSENVLIDQLSEIMGVDKAKLKGVGMKAAARTLGAIRDWVMDTGLEDLSEKDKPAKEKKVNP